MSCKLLIIPVTIILVVANSFPSSCDVESVVSDHKDRLGDPSIILVQEYKQGDNTVVYETVDTVFIHTASLNSQLSLYTTKILPFSDLKYVKRLMLHNREFSMPMNMLNSLSRTDDRFKTELPTEELIKMGITDVVIVPITTENKKPIGQVVLGYAKQLNAYASFDPLSTDLYNELATKGL